MGGVCFSLPSPSCREAARGELRSTAGQAKTASNSSCVIGLSPNYPLPQISRMAPPGLGCWERSEEQFRRDAKVFGQFLNLGLADAALAVHKVGHLGTRTEHRNKIRLLQPALFHQVLDHLVRRLFWNVIVFFVIDFDQRRQDFAQSLLLPR